MPEKKDRRFAKGLVIGSVIATLITLLLAPKSGADTRADIRQQGSAIRSRAATRATEFGSRITPMLEDARENVVQKLGTVSERGSAVISRVRRRANASADEVDSENGSARCCELHMPNSEPARSESEREQS